MHSQPSPICNRDPLLLRKLVFICLSNSLLIVLSLKEPMDAAEGFLQMLLNTSKHTESLLKDNILMLKKDQACQLQGGSFRISSLLGFVGCQGLLAGINDKPVSFMVDASNCGSYSSGVFGNCGTGINHAVLLVGLEWMVWKIKNSWGGGWGKGGFIQLNGGNTCGVCQNPAILIR